MWFCSNELISVHFFHNNQHERGGGRRSVTIVKCGTNRLKLWNCFHSTQLFVAFGRWFEIVEDICFYVVQTRNRTRIIDFFFCENSYIVCKSTGEWSCEGAAPSTWETKNKHTAKKKKESVYAGKRILNSSDIFVVSCCVSLRLSCVLMYTCQMWQRTTCESYSTLLNWGIIMTVEQQME